MDHQTSSSTTTSSALPPNHHSTTYLGQLNKSSHKISKPIIRRTPPNHQTTEDSSQPQHQNPPQPPVYNINKSDFRQVVQKLTGSPAHDSTTPPPPPPLAFPPKPQPSRLHRIRPPPLSQLTTARNPPHFQSTPLSPLPPFPTVHAAAESPISAYMKYLRGTTQWFDPNLIPPPSQPVGEQPSPKSSAPPTGSVPLGQIVSPRSPYPLLSPGFKFSPTSAQLGFPQFWS